MCSVWWLSCSLLLSVPVFIVFTPPVIFHNCSDVLKYSRSCEFSYGYHSFLRSVYSKWLFGWHLWLCSMWSCSLVSQVVVHHDLDLFTPSTFLIFSRGKKANNQGRSSIPPQGNRCCVQRKEPLCSKVDCRKKNTYPLKADKKKNTEKGFVDNMDVVVFFFIPSIHHPLHSF